MAKKTGALVIIGGHEDREDDKDILAEFVRLAGGNRACIAVLTVASQQPKELGQVYIEAFKDIGVAEVRTVDISTREDSYSTDALELLKRATGAFFTGGSQVRITSFIGGSPIDELIQRRYREDGLIVAGTSAGASVMADTMLVNGESETGPRVAGIALGSGLGYLSSVVVDQHFSERGRIGRLIAAVSQNPRYLGLGIDENTAIVVENGHFRVVGTGSVMVVDASDMHYNNFSTAADDEPLALEGIKVSLVAPGYAFNILERRLEREKLDKGGHRV